MMSQIVITAWGTGVFGRWPFFTQQLSLLQHSSCDCETVSDSELCSTTSTSVLISPCGRCGRCGQLFSFIFPSDKLSQVERRNNNDIKMFGEALAKILRAQLGQYLDTEDLEVKVAFTKPIELKNVKLKESAFRDAEIPLR